MTRSNISAGSDFVAVVVIKLKGKASSLDIAPLTVLNMALYNLGSGSRLAMTSTAAHAVAAQSPR